MNNSLAKALASMMGEWEPVTKSVITEGAVTLVSEQYILQNPEYRVRVIVESKVQDLNEALQIALDNEDYKAASVIRDLLNKKTSE